MKTIINNQLNIADLVNDSTVLAITESWIQDEAKEEIGRELTKKEMGEMKEELLNGEDTWSMWPEIIRSAINNVVNDPS